ncbi:cupredoxin domain-containing protein [Occallatibacter riparius]|uniref:Cupredoxin domain-containing protein n=1 Tax=Occallatibacter riparius TaxID=1002689 RepID=A0A9J7BHS3_9BACT|nr:cupredoxin domain-containing protein [Occallatibacter riparius]UWZ82263.1 cupredoxin domain-containing protein [Occallatibacter riparius]
MKKLSIIFVITATFVVQGIRVQSEPVAASASVATSARRVEVTAKRYAFDPAVITLKKGEPVVLVLKSVDVQHGLRFRELNVEVKVPKGGTAQVQFTPDKTGDFVGHCFVFCGEGHGTMALTLHVVS